MPTTRAITGCVHYRFLIVWLLATSVLSGVDAFAEPQSSVDFVRTDFTGGFAGVATSPNPSAIAIGDFNRDGKPDLAVANTCDPVFPACDVGQVVILVGDGAGSFTVGSTLDAGSVPE